MILLNEQQGQSIDNPAEIPPRCVNPRTQEMFVLLRLDEYQRLIREDYDDSPWTSEELNALAWEATAAPDSDDAHDYDCVDSPEHP